ncbi:MAG: cation transporter [Solirubrobacteraceae bacterium]|nr:cation transporter [Solirubrobacteraceae bacterium]
MALALILGLMVLEVVVGAVSSSLALLSDAAHMLTDAAAIGLALFVARLSRRPAAGQMTFGFKRAEILSAQFNGATLLVVALLIVYEGIRRLVSPPGVPGTPLLVVALVGVAVNLAATWTLAGADRTSMNVEGAFQHVLTDLAAFALTALAGIAILVTGFHRADGIAALLVATIMLRAAFGLLKASGRVFLEAAPEDVDVREIGRAMAAYPGVSEVHDLHVWEVTTGFPSLSAHVMVGRDDDCHAVRRNLERLLDDRFGLHHTTLQVEHEGGELLTIETPAPEPWTTLVELGPLSAEQRAELEGDEHDPFDGGRIDALTWRDKDRHVALAAPDGTLYASTALLTVTVEVAGEPLEVVGISGVIVNRAHRDRGAAREIVEAALARAEEMGPSLALLFCHADRAGLYRKLGFTELDEAATVDQPGGRRTMPMVAMWRPLRPGATWPPGPVAVQGLPF